MIIANLALCTLLAIYHLISNARSSGIIFFLNNWFWMYIVMYNVDWILPTSPKHSFLLVTPNCIHHTRIQDNRNAQNGFTLFEIANSIQLRLTYGHTQAIGGPYGIKSCFCTDSKKQSETNTTPPPKSLTPTTHWDGSLVQDRITPSSMLPIPICSQARPRTTDLRRSDAKPA